MNKSLIPEVHHIHASLHIVSFHFSEFLKRAQEAVVLGKVQHKAEPASSPKSIKRKTHYILQSYKHIKLPIYEWLHLPREDLELLDLWWRHNAGSSLVWDPKMLAEVFCLFEAEDSCTYAHIWKIGRHRTQFNLQIDESFISTMNGLHHRPNKNHILYALCQCIRSQMFQMAMISMLPLEHLHLSISLTNQYIVIREK